VRGNKRLIGPAVVALLSLLNPAPARGGTTGMPGPINVQPVTRPMVQSAPRTAEGSVLQLGRNSVDASSSRDTARDVVKNHDPRMANTSNEDSPEEFPDADAAALAAAGHSRMSGYRLACMKMLRSDEDGLILASPDSDAELKGMNLIELKGGSLLVSSGSPLTVRTNFGAVTARKRAIVLIQQSDGEVRVANLSDLSADSVQVAWEGESHKLPIAREIQLTDRSPALPGNYKPDGVRRSNTTCRKSASGNWIKSSEISVQDVLCHEPLLYVLRKEGKSHQERGLVSRVTKTAALLSTVRPVSGDFAQVGVSEETGGQNGGQ